MEWAAERLTRSVNIFVGGELNSTSTIWDIGNSIFRLTGLGRGIRELKGAIGRFGIKKN